MAGVNLEALDRTAQRLVQLTANNSPGNRLNHDKARAMVAQAIQQGEQKRENNNR